MRQVLRFALGGCFALAMAGGALAEGRDFDFKDFARLKVNTGINAKVTLGPAFSVHAESANNTLLDNLQVTLDGDTLAASVDQTFLDFILNGGMVGQLLGNNRLTLTITLPTLVSVSANSAADVEVVGAKGDMEIRVSSGADLAITEAGLGAVHIDVSSGADATLGGTCTTLTARASSGADLNAADLKCTSAVVSASSGGDASVFASASVSANASSGAGISVRGNPAEHTVKSSSGGGVSIED